MLKILQYYLFLFILVGLVPNLYGQKYEKIKYKAEEMVYEKKKGQESYRRLTEDVVFKQKNTTVYCDTSFFYEKRNVMEAFGHVRIVDDSTTITSKKLYYKGNERMAELRENVIYSRGTRKLYTDFLNYDLEAEIAHYFNQGKLVDESNTLTSEIGYYFAQDDFAQFYGDVVLIAPEYVLKTDTLRYNTITKVAYTVGRTEIIDEDGTTLHAKGGEFRTVIDQSDFIFGNIETDDYYLEGDELYFDDLKQYYKAVTNVVMTAKEDDVIITGDEAFYDKANGLSKVYGHPLMKRILEADTFYLSADTLVAIESEYDSAKRILAYHDVKAYKKGLQGIADSMAYFSQDSIIFFYNDPVMWNNSNQVVADTISLEISKKEIKKMNLMTNSFMISEDTIKNYNQIKGRHMEAFFVENEISRINVNGNGEVLYFALEEGDSILMGMNKVFCASMKILFEDQKLTNFVVYTNPDAKFIPPHELTDDLIRLTNFRWRIEERPELYDLAPYLDPNYDPNAPETEGQPDSVTIADTVSMGDAEVNPKPSVLPGTKSNSSKEKNSPTLNQSNPVRQNSGSSSSGNSKSSNSSSGKKLPVKNLRSFKDDD